jgi:2-dehydrotetronate isomerase
MPKFSANLSFLFTEFPFLDRFAAAAAAGFRAVEFAFPYDGPAAAIAARLKEHRLTQALFNTPPGDLAKGERGLAALPGREADFRASLDRALDYAAALSCPRLHVMAGVGGEDATFIANLREAAPRAAAAGVTLLIEPINTGDMPGYFLNTSTHALRIIDAVGSAQVKLQLDLYHCQIMEGGLAAHIRALAGRYAHIQIAGVPDRREPDRGEVNFPYLFDQLDAVGYDGWIGCEYRPAAGTLAGLGWAKRWGIGG